MYYCVSSPANLESGNLTSFGKNLGASTITDVDDYSQYETLPQYKQGGTMDIKPWNTETSNIAKPNWYQQTYCAPKIGNLLNNNHIIRMCIRSLLKL